ncbi:MAG: hypothetical protein ACXAEU_20840 [Candidatus Hodarchaeales archaeon]|jgi:DNA-binding transcriptional regulator GbsR (MarR family)
MNDDDLKKDFVNYMDKMHTGLLYPKKYFGCMMAVVIEQEPVTQDRIEQLTGYSRTTISQMLTLMQVNFPLKQVKKPRIRKKYYTTGLQPRDFMLEFFRVIIDSYKDKVDFMLPLIEELKPYTQEHVRFRNFKQYLEKYHEMATLYIKLFSDTADELSTLIRTGQVNASRFFGNNLLSSQEYLKDIQDLLNPPDLSSSFSDQQVMDEKLVEIYGRLKNRYYQEFRENLTSAGSRTAIARAVIGTELLLEQRPLTQEEIEKATNFQRSIISDTLKLLLKMKMIEIIKKPGDRKKYYRVIQSWDVRMISRLRLNMKYAMGVKEKIISLIEKIKQKNTGEENNTLLVFLQHVHHSYKQYEQYFKLLEMKYLNIRLKEHLDSK